MAIETIHKSPTAVEFVELGEHQSRTPDTFFSGKPVLYFHSSNVETVVEGNKAPFLPLLTAFSESHTTDNQTNGHEPRDSNSLPTETDVWVTSTRFILFWPSAGRGLSISYPSITLHAIQSASLAEAPQADTRQGLYMQLDTGSSPPGDGAEDTDESSIVELTLYLRTFPNPQGSQSTDENTLVSIQTLYEAVSACADLNPDPIDDSDEENISIGGVGNDTEINGSIAYAAGMILPGNNSINGELPPPFPGSQGWITAENMNEHFDEEGNWRNLGAGAGTVRQRESESDDIAEHDFDRRGSTGDDNKWRKTS